MAEIDDLIDQANTALDNAIERVNNDINSLKSQIADLESKPVLTDDQRSKLVSLKERLDQLDPTTPSVIPE